MQHLPRHQRPKCGADCRTFDEARDEVDRLLEDLRELKRQFAAMQGVASKRRHQTDDLKREKRVLTRRIDTISKAQAAAEKLKSTAGWSGAAIGCVTLVWQAMEHYGSPLPPFLMESEIFYGAVCWIATTIFAWVARSYYGAE